MLGVMCSRGCMRAELEELVRVCRKWEVCLGRGGGAVQQEVPRVEAGGADTREGPPRPGEFGELPSGGTQV